MPNPIFGVILHWLGGLAAGSFYVPYRGVRNWSWETYWLAGGFFSWILAPWGLALAMTPAPLEILRQAPGSALFWCYFFGVLWGLGGLTFGLAVRYLGMSLGVAVALGFCAAFGTLVPPVFAGEFMTKVLGTTSGLAILLGVVICLVGIAASGMAGMSKERELPSEQRLAAIREFNPRRGLLVAVFAGVMSACFSYGLTAGDPIKAIALKQGCAPLWQGLPVLIVVLLGGFTTNCLWCLILNVRNRTGYQYFARQLRQPLDVPPPASEGPGPAAPTSPSPLGLRIPRLANWAFSALAGVTWYFQFFFYSMGESQMGDYRFSSWTLHMASIILFSTLWGIALAEWKGTGPRTRTWIATGLGLLLLATVVVGFGNYLAVPPSQ